MRSRASRSPTFPLGGSCAPDLPGNIAIKQWSGVGTPSQNVALVPKQELGNEKWQRQYKRELIRIETLSKINAPNV